MKKTLTQRFARKALVRAIAGATVAGGLGMAGAVYAQETTAVVRGVVTAGGAAVSGATVTATNLSTGLSRSATTDATGNYFIRQLPAGTDYSITVSSSQGGASTERLSLAVGQQAQMNYQLSAIEEVIVVGTQVAVADTAIGPTAVFDLSTLQDSPAINRNINDVIQQDPRIYVEQSGGQDSIQCNGANPRFNSLTIDGVRFNDGFGLNSNGYPDAALAVPLRCHFQRRGGDGADERDLRRFLRLQHQRGDEVRQQRAVRLRVLRLHRRLPAGRFPRR
jgi:hypothetical protein